MKKIYTIISILFITSLYAQIDYKIKNVKVNGILIPDNSPIEFNGQPSVVVNFKVEFTKPADLYIGGVSHVIGTYNSLGQFRQLISPEQFSLPSVTNTGFSGTWEKTLYASDYTYDGGNYLVSILQQTDALQNGRWESNRVYIDRGPNFQLNYSTLSMPCGDTTQRTFTISNLSNSTGVISYNWNIGSGWSGTVNSNMSSITLTPLNGNVLPSNVSVTPIYNSVTQATKTCVVSRAPFTSTATIIGASSLCTSSNYAINGLLSGETILWSVSNNSIASLSNITATSVTVNKIGNGTINLLATITNPCNQTAIVSKSINIGAPTFSSTNMSGDSNPLTGETKVYFVQAPTGYNSLEWYFDYGGTTGTSVNGWEILNGQGTTSITAKVGNPGLTYVVCKAFNNCSNSIQYIPVAVRSLTDPCGFFKINTKNPIKETDNLIGKIVPPPIDPCDDLNAKLINKKESKKIQVFDLFGRVIFSDEFIGDNFDFKLEKLTTGTYLLNITLQDGKTQHETIIVK